MSLIPQIFCDDGYFANHKQTKGSNEQIPVQWFFNFLFVIFMNCIVSSSPFYYYFLKAYRILWSIYWCIDLLIDLIIFCSWFCIDWTCELIAGGGVLCVYLLPPLRWHHTVPSWRRGGHWRCGQQGTSTFKPFLRAVWCRTAGSQNSAAHLTQSSIPTKQKQLMSGFNNYTPTLSCCILTV